MDNLLVINTSAERVKKARLNKYLNTPIRWTIYIISIVAFCVGLYVLILDHNKVGWLAFIVPSLAIMIIEWWRSDIAKDSPALDGKLPEELLDAKMIDDFKKSNNSLSEIIQLIKKQNGRIFLANRFFLTDELLSSLQINDCSSWWPNTIQFWKEHYDEQGIDSAHICVSLILNADNAKDCLISMGCSEEDLIKGLDWYLYLKRTIRTLSKRRDSGGIARDWSAGYTPLLNRFGRNISLDIKFGSATQRSQVIHEEVINQMLNIFDSGGRSNCALVGDVGVGKDMCVHGFAENILFDEAKHAVKYNQIFQIDTTAITSATESGKIENIISRIFLEAYKAKNIILYFSDAEQLFEPINNKEDLTEIITPYIKGGRVRTIFSFTPKTWQFLERQKPGVVALLNYQAVAPPDEADTLLILQNKAIFIENQYNCVFTYNSLTEIYRLAERYGPDIAMPGRAITVMEAAGRQGSKGLVTKEVVQQSIEATTGVKVGIANTEERDVLLNLEEKLRQRVVGQEQAIKEISTALRRSRAGVASNKKPIGTFLFLGPTGVGKTELSKSLAEVYFGGEDNIVRVDMNEYITTDSVNRILASGGQSTPTFLDYVRRQPFSVILLDEIEKAHPDINNVLLQMLDEGVLKDNENHTISFKDSIVIATSNAGASYIRQNISAKDVELSSKDLTNKLIEEGIFKPEFLNRFDAIIIFSPLTDEQLRKIVAIMVNNINKGLSNQQLSVSLTQEAIGWLVANGNDELLGARPLRRLIQNTVENIVSNKILEGTTKSGDTITINIEDLQKIV